MWKSININRQNIKQETAKAVLIQCPHNSEWDGYSFWHPAKLVRDGRHSNAVSIGYTDDFTFRLKKCNKRFEVIDEVELNASEFEEMFGVMDRNIVSPTMKDPYETHKPESLPTEETEAIEELRDDE